MRHTLLSLIITLLSIPAIASPYIINVTETKGDATTAIQKAIDRAAKMKGNPVEIRLAPGAEYNISRAKSTPCVYRISNTTSVTDSPDPTKHIGMYIKDVDNLTINGNGATLVTHGEMTTWVIDNCNNITLRDFTLKAADPSVPEMTVTSVSDSSFTAIAHPQSSYDIRDGRLWWTGEGWEFTNGVAQIYHPDRHVTYRCDSPIYDARLVSENNDGLLTFNLPYKPQVRVGDIYQMRHSFRTEVCGFINRSNNVTLDNLTLHFLGNFGIVSQFSTDLSYSSVRCTPEPDSGRTCAGFADFIQISGCKGKVSITDCYFNGSQNDPINIHGTQLRIVERKGKDRVKVRFSHDQTFGFPAFYPGDSIALNSTQSLLTLERNMVTEAVMDGEYHMWLTLSSPLIMEDIRDIAVENITWNPDVEISRCRFECSPVRGILVTTPGKVVIRDNEFFRIAMNSVFIDDDANIWYESGAVRDVTITGNRFIECATPVINISPEIRRYDGPVHSGITISGNTFEGCNGTLLRAVATDRLTFTGNTAPSISVELIDCTNPVVR